MNNIPRYLGGHILAITGVTLLHGGLAVWAMQPEPPVAIPQQQIIQVSYVAPTIMQKAVEKKIQKQVKQLKAEIPPQETGMIKIEPQSAQIEVEEEVVTEEEEPEMVIEQQEIVQLTSGLQSETAKLKEAAITKPVAAEYLNNPAPSYPSSARRRHQQGTVLLNVTVSESGNAKHVKIKKSSGFDVLDDSAMKTVYKWSFVPARRGSEKVEANVVVPIEFRIN